jgi:hypothetical protein
MAIAQKLEAAPAGLGDSGWDQSDLGRAAQVLMNHQPDRSERGPLARPDPDQVRLRVAEDAASSLMPSPTEAAFACTVISLLRRTISAPSIDSSINSGPNPDDGVPA